MDEQPVYIHIPTEDEQPLLNCQSCAEAVITTVIEAQKDGWMRLHGFVVLPEALEMVVTPLRQNISVLVGYIESETAPRLNALLPVSGMTWSRCFMRSPLENQRALDARLGILLLMPVARGLAEHPETYPYSSAHPRYIGATSPYAGFPPAS
jgi:hypothetical protein